MRTIEWQTFQHLIQETAAGFPASDITQEEIDWRNVNGADEAIIQMDILWTDSVGSFPNVVLEMSDDPESGVWSVVWSNPNAQSGVDVDRDATYLVTLSRQIPLNRPYRLGNVLRWRVTGFPTALGIAEIAFSITLTLR